ncbi:MAG TPA: FAD-binding oxidoreductase [Casimicrobiaceae bacterium]|nr:FAD-binding oxidoreductase [Casimicrobiaceae bacterium]
MNSSPFKQYSEQQRAMRAKCDVAIVGGAVIGSAVAYFLKRLAPAVDVAVIEPDRTYEFASTLRASGGARRQFSCPENIAMSNFSIPFIASAGETLAVDGEPAHVEWHEGGYLFIVGPGDVDVLRRNCDAQQAHGVDARWLDADALRARFASMNVDGIAAGVLTPEDGWCDPNGLLQGLRRKARALGAAYVDDRVVAIDHDAAAVRALRLASGAILRADVIVNAAGAWARQIAAMVDMPLPIAPLRRFEHYFETPNAIEPLPYVKDTARLAFRPEGRGYSGGLVDSSETRGYNFDVDHDYFERVVWPALAHRFPAFEACRCRRTWSGLYEQNELDGNPVIGNGSGRLANFHVVAGFSGHGMMHAPAAGRAVAELIVRGRFESIDLARLGYARIAAHAPYPERGII